MDFFVYFVFDMDKLTIYLIVLSYVSTVQSEHGEPDQARVADAF